MHLNLLQYQGIINSIRTYDPFWVEVKTMLVKKPYKFRICPNKEQEILIAKTIGCSRFVFNRFLARWNDAYKESDKGLTYTTHA